MIPRPEFGITFWNLYLIICFGSSTFLVKMILIYKVVLSGSDRSDKGRDTKGSRVRSLDWTIETRISVLHFFTVGEKESIFP